MSNQKKQIADLRTKIAELERQIAESGGGNKSPSNGTSLEERPPAPIDKPHRPEPSPTKTVVYRLKSTAIKDGVETIALQDANKALAHQRDQIAKDFEQSAQELWELMQSIAELNGMFILLDGIALGVSFNESPNQRAAALKAAILTKHNGKNKQGELGGAYAQVLADAVMISPELVRFTHEELAPTVSAYRNAMIAVCTGQDTGEQLVALAGSRAVTENIVALSPIIKQSGRKKKKRLTAIDQRIIAYSEVGESVESMAERYLKYLQDKEFEELSTEESDDLNRLTDHLDATCRHIRRNYKLT